MVHFTLFSAVGFLSVIVQVASAGRNHSEIRRFSITPAYQLPNGTSFTDFIKACKNRGSNANHTSSDLDSQCKHIQEDPSDNGNLEMVEDCKDGTYCWEAGCGHWLGQDKMCCTGVGGSEWHPENSTWLANYFQNGCEPYKEFLGNYKIVEGKKPMDTGCEIPDYNNTKDSMANNTNYPVGYTDYMPLRFDGPPTCCSTEDDSITLLYAGFGLDHPEAVKQAVCIPPVIKSKSESGTNGSSTSGSSTKSFGTLSSSATSASFVFLLCFITSMSSFL